MAKTNQTMHSAYRKGKGEARLDHYVGFRDKTHGHDEREVPSDCDAECMIKERLGRFVSDGDKKP
jgi:hypothetical protein